MKNIAFAGCAHIHTPSFIKMLKERSGEFKVVKVWDHNAERAKANAESLNAVVCETPEEIANDPAIDAVVITSETNRHLELTTRICRRRCKRIGSTHPQQRYHLPDRLFHARTRRHPSDQKTGRGRKIRYHHKNEILQLPYRLPRRMVRCRLALDGRSRHCRLRCIR